MFSYMLSAFWCSASTLFIVGWTHRFNGLEFTGLPKAVIFVFICFGSCFVSFAWATTAVDWISLRFCPSKSALNGSIFSIKELFYWYILDILVLLLFYSNSLLRLHLWVGFPIRVNLELDERLRVAKRPKLRKINHPINKGNKY